MDAVQRAPEQGCGALASANVFGEAFGNSGCPNHRFDVAA